ncbi:MAG: putative porin, partial [Bacteroidia bacterium]
MYALEDSFLYKPGQYTTIDTSLNNIDLIDRGLLNGNFYQRINNFGSAAYNLEFSPIRTIGFNIGLINHRLHHFNSKQLRYYNSYTPYTQFRYIQGDGELQMLEIFHSQSITERLNLAVTYNSTISAGFYENEVNRLTNVGLHSHYVNKKGNYRLMLFGIWNTNSLDENGGIENVSDFDLDIYSTSRARISQSSFLESDYWFRNSSIGLRQMYYLGKQDSINVKGYGHDKRFLPRAYLTHKLIYEQNSTNYETADYDYFNNNYTFIEDVYENIEHRELSNELGIGLFFNKKEVYFLPRHGRGHFISPSKINFKANIDALKQLGVTDIVSVSA